MASRRQYSGNAPATVLQTSMTTSTPATINVSAGTGTNYPDGSVGSFYIVIDRGTASEEKILCSARTSDTFTIASRGADSTNAASHTSGTAVVEHVFTKTDADEANAHVAVATQDDHTQYIKVAGARAAGDATAWSALVAAISTSAVGDAAAAGTALTWARGDHKHGREGPHRTSVTFSVQSYVSVPSGALDYICPAFIPVASGRTCKLVGCKYVIQSGTSVTAKVQKNGVDATGFTGISVTTTPAATTPTAVSLADGDYLAVVVTAISGTPQNMSFSLYLEHA